MELSSVSGSQLNLDALYQLCPSCFTEVRDEKSGGVKRKIDFNVLRELLGDNAFEGADEQYGFSWVGKQAARREAAKVCTKTLRPCPKESVDWNTTENLYIEGDNLEVLKLLQKSYLGKVKMIYIDPPYNTGNDFVYRDDFAQSADDYDLSAGNVDEVGNRLRKNTDTNARFHSDWCSMIYERLLVARSLLTEDGAIFISIDDHEVENLRIICNELFGSCNFVAQVIWEQGRKSAGKTIAINHEYCLIYCKSLTTILLQISEGKSYWKAKKEGIDILYSEEAKLRSKYGNNLIALNEEYRAYLSSLSEDSPAYPHKHYKCIDAKGIYFPADASAPDSPETRSHKPLVHPITMRECKVPRLGWRYKEKTLMELYANGMFHFGKDENTIPCIKRYLKDTEYEVASSIIYKDGRGASNRLKSLLAEKVFDFPKDEFVILYFIKLICLEDSHSIILDFFSGSATTAHAVMQLNAEDGGNRKFIMVQLPEETEEKSEARKAGYANICEIGKERIRRAGKKIKKESPLTTQNLDTGFRVFKCEESFMNEVYFNPSALEQNDLFRQVDNVKPDTTDMQLLFGCMLDWGVQLSLPLADFEVEGKKIYNVNDGDLVACFAHDINEAVIAAIAELQPLRVVFRDSCFSEAALKMNLFELFKQRCGWSEEMVQSRVHVI